eukprot:14888594-Alexandrium_andersonii.AAC.1
MKSPRVANALQNVRHLRPRQLLHEFALEQPQAADVPQTSRTRGETRRRCRPRALRAPSGLSEGGHLDRQ